MCTRAKCLGAMRREGKRVPAAESAVDLAFVRRRSGAGAEAPQPRRAELPASSCGRERQSGGGCPKN